MKTILIFLLFIFSSCIVWGQGNYLKENKQLKEEAYIHLSPNADKQILLTKNTDIRIYSDENSEWHNISVPCFIKEKDVITLNNAAYKENRGVLKKGAELYDYKGKSIGQTLIELEFESDLKVNGLLRTGFNGYIKTNTIGQDFQREDILNSKEVLKYEVCNVQFYSEEGKILKNECDYGPNKAENLIEQSAEWRIHYFNDYGLLIKVRREIDYLITQVKLNGAKINSLIRVEKTQINPIGVEKFGPNTVFHVKIFKYENREWKLVKRMQLYADEIDILENGIKLETYGFGGIDASSFELIHF